MTATPTPPTAVALRPAPSGFGLMMSPQTIADAEKFCQTLAKTDFVPKAFRGKPESIMVVGAMGARLGVDVFTAMAGIADINGKPCVYGDLMMAVCQNHPEFEDCLEEMSGKPYEDDFTAVCTVKRKGRAPIRRTFSVIEAKEASLWKKAGPWTTTPQRMLAMRARAFALRDGFADALAGMHSVEEMADVIDVTATATVHKDPPPARRRTVEAQAEAKPEASPAKAEEAKPEPAAEVKTLGEHAAAAGIPAETAPPAPPEPTTARCQEATAALMKRGPGGKVAVGQVMKRWSLRDVAQLAEMTNDDRQAYLDEIAEADARLETKP